MMENSRDMALMIANAYVDAYERSEGAVELADHFADFKEGNFLGYVGQIGSPQAYGAAVGKQHRLPFFFQLRLLRKYV